MKHKNKLIKILRRMRYCLVESIRGRDTHCVNLEKLLIFGFYYGLLKGIYFCGDKRGAEADQALHISTGIETSYFESMRSFRNTIYHLKEKMELADIERLKIQELRVHNFYFVDDYVYILYLINLLEELIDCVEE